MKRVLFLILLLVGLTGLAQAEPAAEEAIIKVLREAEAGWNAGDIPAYMNSYWQSPDLRFASGGTVSYGWQPVLDRYLKRYPDQKTMGQLVFADLDVRLTGPDHAVAFGSWRLLRSEDEPHGLFTLVFRHFDEGWRIIHDHTSSAVE
jgi:ketosteroid isomerase-like protein